MPNVPSPLALAAAALLAGSAAAAAPELPFDPNVCVTRVKSGEPGAPPTLRLFLVPEMRLMFTATRIQGRFELMGGDSGVARRGQRQ